jgi:putative ABC transport system permease protein
MSWLQRVFRGRIDARAELDPEIAFHLAEETRLRAERGDPPERARFEARRAFGNAMRVREQIDRLNPTGTIDEIWRDLTYGARLLRRNPGFAVVAILSLALGIGANTSIFQLLDAVRLRTLPVKDSGQLAEVRVANANDGRSGNFTGERPELTNPLWEHIRAEQQGFSRIFAWGATSFEMASGGESQRAQGLWVSGDFFGTLEIEPVLGRLFTTADDVRGCGAPGAIISYAFWHRRYGADRQVVGRSLRLDGQVFPIIGVAPPGFFGVDVGTSFDVAVPICAERLTRGGRSRLGVRRAWWLAAIGRLKPGWSIERASAQLNAISPAIFAATVEPTYIPRSAKQYLKFRLGAFPAATGVSNLREDYETPLWLLLAIAGLVLLIACANLANLMLARATAREREIAVRLAIGASRRRIIRQLLAESLLLAVCGSTLGVLLSQGLSTFLVSLFGDAVVIDLRADWHVLGFTASLAVGACVLFGLAPAVRATGTTPASVIKTSARGTTGSRESFGLRRALVVVQVALSLVLVVGALLFVRTLQNLMTVDPGFREDGILVTTLDFRQTGVADSNQGALHRDLLERVTRVPGVQSAASVFIPPISGGGWWNETILVDGVVQRAEPNLNWISSGFFKTMQTSMVAGRDFDEHDTLSAPPVTIVNESFARVFFGSKSPLGRTFQIETGPGEPQRGYAVVGLVRDTKYDHVREPFGPIAFFPTRQDPKPGSSDRLVIRSSLPLPTLVAAVKRAVAEANPNILIKFETLASQVEKSLLRERLMATLSGFFGALAGLLATIGLYGVMSYMVARRRSEIGIRMALGADRALVVRLMLREALVLLGAGVLLGLALAAAAARATASLLFGLEPGDPATLAAAVAVLGAVGVLSSYLPARRASRLEPTVVLRED